MLGALRVTTGLAGGWPALPRLVEPDILRRWVPGVALGSLLFWLLRVRRRPLAFVAALGSVVPAFYLLLAVSGMSIDGARAAVGCRRRRGESSLAGLWSGGWRWVRWEVLPGITGIVGSVLATSVLSILLNASGVELLTRRGSWGPEPGTAGGGAGESGECGGGGMVGFQSLNLTRLAFDLGARGRWAGVAAAGVCLLGLAAGPGPATYVPRFLLGALLCQLGLGFLHDWVVVARARLPRADYAVVLLILGAIGALGYVQGVAVGVLAAVILFVHNYSRVSVVTHTLSAADHPSNVDRPPGHRRLLAESRGLAGAGPAASRGSSSAPRTPCCNRCAPGRSRGASGRCGSPCWISTGSAGWTARRRSACPARCSWRRNTGSS